MKIRTYSPKVVKSGPVGKMPKVKASGVKVRAPKPTKVGGLSGRVRMGKGVK